MNSPDIIDERFYKRWAGIYVSKGKSGGWPAAKEWVRRTFAPPLVGALRPHIERAMGVRK